MRLARPYLALSRIHAQVGVLNRLVLNRLGGSTARLWCYSVKNPSKTSAKQKRDRGRDSQPRPRPRWNSQPQGATKSVSHGKRINDNYRQNCLENDFWHPFTITSTWLIPLRIIYIIISWTMVPPPPFKIPCATRTLPTRKNSARIILKLPLPDLSFSELIYQKITRYPLYLCELGDITRLRPLPLSNYFLLPLYPVCSFPNYLDDRNLLKLRSLDSSCPFFLSDDSIWGEWTQILQMLWSQG